MPAAAVIRRGQALLGFIGRKANVGGFCKSGVKSLSSTEELPLILLNLRTGEESGIPGVAVECVDIGRNTRGEGGFLDWS